jgi:hypothetical protein
MFVQHELTRVGDVFRCAACGRQVPCGDSPHGKMIEPALMSFPCPSITGQQRDQADKFLAYDLVYAANIGRGEEGQEAIRAAWDAMFADVTASSQGSPR